MFKRIFCVLAVVALAWVTPAFAQCGPPNLLTGDSCSFDGGLGNWVSWDVNGLLVDPGVAAPVATGGRTSPGAMSLTTADNGAPPFGFGFSAGFYACVAAAVPAGANLGFGMYVNPADPPGTCEVSLALHNNPTCDDAGVLSQNFDQSTPVPGMYSKVNDDDATLSAPAGVQSFSIRAYCFGAMTGTTILVDDAYVGDLMVPVELQSFTAN